MQQMLREGDARLRYQAQESPQTLAEGLAEYYAANERRVTRPSDLPPESAALFRSHDMCHVIFGLDTSLRDEIFVDMRTVLCCDVEFQRYAAYIAHDPQAKALFKELDWLRTSLLMVAAIPRFLRAVWQALRMKKRWPWTPPAEYAQRTLADLRREYRIQVI